MARTSRNQTKNPDPANPAVKTAEADNINLASLTLKPQNADAAESLKIEAAITASGSALRNNASVLLDGVQLPTAENQICVTALKGERPEWHDELLLAICNALHSDSTPLFKEGAMKGLHTPPIRDRASYIGCAFFCDALIKSDAALAEEILHSLSKVKADAAMILPRLENFMLEHANRELLPIGTLLEADAEERNALGTSYFVRGTLKPYLLIAQAIPDRRSFFGFLSSTPRTPSALEDLVISKRSSVFLNEFVEASQVKVKKPKLEGDLLTEAEASADPDLQTIFNTLKNEYDILNTVESYVAKKKELSVYDLAMIAHRLPRGVTWGRQQDFPNIPALSKSKNEHQNFEPVDLYILLSAISKTTCARGSELLGLVAGEVRSVVSKSCGRIEQSKSSPEFKQEIDTLFSNTLGAMFGKLLST